MKLVLENEMKKSRARNLAVTVVLACFCVAGELATAGTLDAVWNSAADVPVTANGYTATGNTVSFTLNFAPPAGTDLMVVNNTNLGFISGTFDNLGQGQAVALSYSGVTYRFVANYWGGSGNDLVLVWSSKRAFGWGLNRVAEIGDNTLINRLLPTPVCATGLLAGKTILALAAGYFHSLALCSDNTLAAWGGNSAGELGDNGASGTRSVVPVAVNTAAGVSALHGKVVVAVAAGGTTQGGDYDLALSSDGTVAAWGDNSEGALGDNSGGYFGARKLAPVAVNTAQGVSALYGKTVVAVSAGNGHSLALCSDGTVAAWGRNLTGEVGNNTTTKALAPSAVNTTAGVSALYGKTVVAIAAGGYHSLGLCSDGTVVAWGDNYYGEIGDSTTTRRLVPVAVNTNSGVSALYQKRVVAIAAGLYHSLALCSDGTVAAWGWNMSGQLGDNGASGGLVPVAVNRTAGLSALQGKTVVAIAAGAEHSMALCSEGTLAAWGLNSFGELGNGTTNNSRVPVAVNKTPLATGQRFVEVTPSPASVHSLAMVAAPPACQLALIGAQRGSDGSFQFAFTNTPGAFFGVLAATNPALPLGEWMTLGTPAEVSPGQFQFTDAEATNSPARFYFVRSP